jgi:hypothetical protein
MAEKLPRLTFLDMCSGQIGREPPSQQLTRLVYCA